MRLGMICGHYANWQERTASVHDILRDQHNSSHNTEPNLIIVLSFIQNIPKFQQTYLTAIFGHGFRIKQIFFSGRYSCIEQYVLRILAFRTFSFSQKFGQPFRFRIALNAIFSSSLLNKQLWRHRLESQLMDAMYGMLPKEPHFQSIQSNRCYISWLASSKFGQLWLVMKMISRGLWANQKWWNILNEFKKEIYLSC